MCTNIFPSSSVRSFLGRVHILLYKMDGFSDEEMYMKRNLVSFFEEMADAVHYDSPTNGC